MEVKNETSKYLLALVLSDLIFALGAAYVYVDLRDNRLAKIDALNSQIASLGEMERRASVVNQLLTTSKTARDKVDLYFVTKGTAANFIAELESLASDAGVTFRLNSLSVVKDAKQQNQPSYLKVNLRVEGGFSGVFHFLTIVENLPYQIRFNAVNLSKASSWSVDMDLDLISYIDK